MKIERNTTYTYTETVGIISAAGIDAHRTGLFYFSLQQPRQFPNNSSMCAIDNMHILNYTSLINKNDPALR